MAFTPTNRPVAVFDIECYVNYFSIGFKSIEDGRTKVFEFYDGCPLDKRAIAKIFRMWTLVGFNSAGYDIPMILYAMSGATNEELKAASDQIIQFGVRPWTFMDRYGLTMPEFIDHIDLMQVSPGAPTMPSLKIYAGRLHSRKMQELPIPHDASIGEAERQVLRSYHINDLDVTIDQYNDLRAQVELRTLMSVEYGLDLRSKSDAQIAEAVIKTEIQRATGKKVYAPEIQPGYFPYTPPAFIKFTTPEMQATLDGVVKSKFIVDRDGIVKGPDYLKNLKIAMGQSVYKMGIGGLHSTETRATHYSDDDYVLLDRDVTSYYPMIILECGLFPKHIGPLFLDIYKRIFDRRIAAKRSGDKNTSETLKIVLNGSFGKLGSPYSALYSPNLLIQVTITGQLAVLMLIEAVEQAGMRVVSANTDGFVTKVPRARRDEFNAICAQWEKVTKFGLEEAEYRSLHSRDVNNYIALEILRDKKGVQIGLKIKTKGDFTSCGPGLPGASGQKKNPNMPISTDAVVALLVDGTPIEQTISKCTDPRKFVVVRRVTGGALDQDGEQIGKALRWYYSNRVTGPFTIAKNCNTVSDSNGAKLMMTLPDALPKDVDYDYYIREAYAILQDIGAPAGDPALRGKRGQIIARLPEQKTYHLVLASTGVALCGKTRDSIRDSWVDAPAAPEGRGMCSKCLKEDDL